MKINTIEVLETLRDSHSLSVSNIAQSIGVNQQSVRKWSTGRIPNRENRVKLSKLYKEYQNPAKISKHREMLEALNSRKNISYAALAKIIKVSPSTIYNWLSGRTVPTEEYVLNIEDTYYKYYTKPKPKVEEIFEEKKPEEVNSETWLKLRDALRLDLFMARSATTSNSDLIILETMNYLHERLSR